MQECREEEMGRKRAGGRKINDPETHDWLIVAATVVVAVLVFVAVGIGIQDLVTTDTATALWKGGAPAIMAIFFNVIANLLIIAGILIMIFFVGRIIFSGSSQLEVAIRSIAAVTGFLIYFGAKAVVLSIPQLMLSAISTTTPAAVGFLGIVVPGLAGTIVAWYCLKSIQQHEELAFRLVVLISTFIVVLFGDAYVAAVGNNGISRQGINEALLPNSAFTVGIALYIIFRYLPEGNSNPHISEQTLSWTDRLTNRVDRQSGTNREANFRDGQEKDIDGQTSPKETKPQGADFTAVDFTSTDLSKIDLKGANLSSAKLQRVDLSRSNLQAANLLSANLYSANLKGLDLRSVTFSVYSMSDRKANPDTLDAYLRCANLEDSDLRGVDLQEAILTGANLQEANLNMATLKRAKLNNAKLSGTNLKEADLSGVDLTGAEGLTLEQVRQAIGYPQTKLSDYLPRPLGWSN
jgi:uncharacterized protein YjbI with pentapeptide repeats